MYKLIRNLAHLINPLPPIPPNKAGGATNLEKGSLAINISVLFWYRRISISARVPGRYRRFLPLGMGSPAPRVSQTNTSTQTGHRERRGGVRCVARDLGAPPMRAPPRRAKAPPPEERREDAEGCRRCSSSWAIACGSWRRDR